VKLSILQTSAFILALVDPFADQRGFAKAGWARNKGYARQATRRVTGVQPFDQARSGDNLGPGWGI